MGVYLRLPANAIANSAESVRFRTGHARRHAKAVRQETAPASPEASATPTRHVSAYAVRGPDALPLSLVRARTHREEERDHCHHHAVPDHVLAALVPWRLSLMSGIY